MKARILIVDDNAANRAVFSAVLEPLGHDVTAVDGGLRALEEALRADFAVILLDLRMPDLDGLQVAGILRTRERTRYTPILLVSAYEATPAVAAAARLVGAVDYLFSPVDPDLLRLKVAAFAELFLHQERARILHEATADENLALQAQILRLRKQIDVRQGAG